MVSVQEDTSGNKVFVFLLSHLSQCYKYQYINVLLGQVTCPIAVPTCPAHVPIRTWDSSGTARDTCGTCLLSQINAYTPTLRSPGHVGHLKNKQV
nr:MAG TPA: hypothetical protein [Caudoviricetes sp.]